MVRATYQHYKGGTYSKLMEAEMEATLEPVVIYRGQDSRTWVRPKSEFYEKVEHNGKMVDRFKLLTSYDL